MKKHEILQKLDHNLTQAQTFFSNLKKNPLINKSSCADCVPNFFFFFLTHFSHPFFLSFCALELLFQHHYSLYQT